MCVLALRSFICLFIHLFIFACVNFENVRFAGETAETLGRSLDLFMFLTQKRGYFSKWARHPMGVGRIAGFGMNSKRNSVESCHLLVGFLQVWVLVCLVLQVHVWISNDPKVQGILCSSF